MSDLLAALAVGELASAADVAIAQRGAPVVRERLGVEPGDRFLLFSLSKTLTAVVVLALADAGAVDLDAPVARYVPPFGSGGKDVVTVADVLAHRGGFSELSSGEPLGVHDFVDAERALGAICALPYDPALHGVAVYHPLSYSILAHVVAAAAEAPFEDVCARAVLEPLGMDETTWGLPPAARVHAVPLVGPETATWADPALVGGVIAAGNAFSTADDMLRLFLMLRGRGTLAGRAVLREETVEAMVAPRAPARGQAGAHAFGYGLFLGSEPGTLSGRGATASDRCFGHAGFTATQAWHEPEGDLTAVVLTNSCVGQEESDRRFQAWADEVRRRHG